MSLIICETFEINETMYGFLIVSFAISMKETTKSVVFCKNELQKFRSNRSMIKNDKNRLNMIISNFLSNNIYNLSICLGVPYLINSLFFSNDNFFSNVYYGTNIAFMIAGLISCLILFLILLMLSKFRLTRNFGFSILSIWLIYTVLVVLTELNIIYLFIINYEIKRC
jgi:sodium/potassium/calcium exchanger 4